MASLHRRIGSPFFWGKFRDESGAIRFRSTKKSNRKDALEIVLGWQRGADAGRSGEITKAVVLKTLNEILERTTGERVEMFSVRKFFLEWLQAKTTTGKAKGTAARYKPVLNGFFTCIGDKRAAMTIGGVASMDVERFRNREIELGKSASSADLAVKILRAVFNDAKRKGLILVNPADGVELLAGQAHERKPFADSEVVALLNAADIEWRGMILLGAHAGCRIGDAAALRWKAVDLATGTLELIPQKTARRRHGKLQPIVMHPELLTYFEELPTSDDPNAPVFPTLHLKTAGGHQGLSNAFATLMSKAGIRQATTARIGGKGRSFNALSFHSLRHTFVSRLANAEVGADVRKAIVGHSSDEIHRRYTHLDLAVQRKALNRIEPFAR